METNPFARIPQADFDRIWQNNSRIDDALIFIAHDQSVKFMISWREKQFILSNVNNMRDWAGPISQCSSPFDRFPHNVIIQTDRLIGLGTNDLRILRCSLSAKSIENQRRWRANPTCQDFNKETSPSSCKTFFESCVTILLIPRSAMT
jgi:hypothetical protein